MAQNGGRFDFDDGGSYSGGWLEGKAHGYGVCTGPKGQGEYAGAWVRGFEESGVYTWPSGNTYSGEWQDGKRHGVGVEIKGHWVYRGEWSQGYKGRYGVRQSTISCARYEGTWTTSFQDGYGVETYVDEGTYQGQWQRGMRHGLGVRHSAPFGIAAQYRDKQHLHGSLPSSMNSHASMATMEQQRGRSGSSDVAVTDRHRGGFVLTGRSTPGFNDAEQIRSRSSSSGRSFAERFRLRRGQSTGDLPRSVHHSTGASPTVTLGVDGRSALGGSGDTGHGLLGSNVDIADGDVTETYMGEWKTDKRSGYGVSERSDGLKYVGEWFNDKKFGYGVTTLKDGTKEEGKYKDNELITSGKKRKLFGISRTRLRDRVDGAIVAASRAAEMAQQRAVVAATRRANARQRAESSDKAAMKALSDADLARDEADKFLQHTPQTTTVPVNQETRVRMLPGQEERSRVHDHRRHPPHDQGRTTGGGESETGKTSRLLPPRQESSDSYTSNQSSSVGSSSAATTSPPPPKPPRSSPSTVDGGGGHQEGLGPADGDDTRYPSRDEPPPGRTPQALPSQVVVSRTAVPLFNRGPGNVSRLDQHQQQHPSPANHATRPSVNDRGYSQTLDARSNQAARTNLTGGSGGGGATSADRRSNSFRNFRSSAPMERSSYVDVSDSGDSGHQSSSRTLRAVVAGEGGHQPGSPQILLHPATPTGRQNSQRAPPQSGERARLRSSSDEAPPPPAPSRSQAMPVDPTRRTVSPVLSDRQYQQPISLVLSRDSDSSSRDRDLIVDNHHQQQHHRQLPNNDYYAGDAGSGTRLPPDSFPARHLPQMPSSSSSNTAGIPTRQPNSSNSRSSSAAPSSSGGSFRSHADSRGREYRSGTSSPKTWDRMSRQRRETLPSIVQYPPQPSTSSKPGLGGAGGDHRQSSKEMYLIENGVRRRLVSDSGVWGTPTMTSEREPPLLQRFVVEETPSGVGGGGLEKRGIKSSLPDVRRVRETTELIPREQMSVLSQRRRDEMRREREERERETVVIRLVDIKTWCKENQLIVFLVALNLSLAAMFLSFLTRSKDTPR